MEWRGQRESGNIIDRRGGGGGGFAMGGGIGGAILTLIYYLMTGGGGQSQPSPQSNGPNYSGPNYTNTQTVDPGQDSLKHFVAVVLGSTEDVWSQIFAKSGKRYTDPHLVLFSNRIQSACGSASMAMGPFYCPEDQDVYIDLSFYNELKNKLGAPGDFAEAYVIAHEVGHHVQKLLGLSDQITAEEQQADEKQRNALSVRLELQADFYAGVWAHYAKDKGLLDPGDIDEALNAASAVGDDRLQQESQGYVVPDAFTHGTSAERSRWFKKGFDTGDPTQGDTFNAPSL